MYCANAKKIFRRLNFRDYFLSFILPGNDTLFDDLDLDACQLFDFVKKNIKPDKRIDEELTTVINEFEKSEARRNPITTVATSTDRTEFTTLLKELLDESSKTTASTARPTKGTTWSAPSLKTPTSSTAHPPLKPTRTTVISTRRDTTKQHTTRVATTPTTLTTITSTTRSTPTSVSAPTDVTNVKNEEEEYEEEKDDEYNEEKPENVSVEVVPIRDMGGIRAVLVNATPGPAPSTKSRLFSDDSWEQPPPNFGYSSMRYPNGGVTPLNIDTSTYFGMDDDIKDDDDTEEEGDSGKEAPLAVQPPKEPQKKKVDIRKVEAVASVAEPVHPTQDLRRSPIYITQRIQTPTTAAVPLSSTTTPEVPTHTTEVVTSVTPLLRGDVAVRRIHEWNDDTRSRELGATLLKEPVAGEEVEDHISTEPVEHTEPSLEIGNTTILPRLNIDWSDRETLILIGSLLIAIVIFALMCILICCVWCRRKRASHDFKTTY
ncbi:hypothetical protein OESDEN_13919 [Oesophagostomum dentatum]|uniref:Uncharacterized protein n=1 Tax=Oesophagostomum dentatum TaxID=61180 RepID=A0A0B1SSZ9_OESDE|nr:hypothetical protein OESDEN_13919 [Oesophagostomum dentatum]